MQANVKCLIILAIFFSNTARAKKCGRRPFTQLPLILGGEDSVPGEWPWHAAIYHSENEESTPTYQCGGTLISSMLVLTAAHCTFRNMIPLSANLFRLRLGLTLIDDAVQQEHGVVMVVRHFKYNPFNQQYDIALLKAVSKIKFTDFIQPACLPADDYYFSRGTVVGWGIGDRNRMEAVLQKADLNLVDYATCLKSDASLFSVLLSTDYSNYCAGNSNMTNVCFGDSGGGMFTYNAFDSSWYIRGITNAGVRIDPSSTERCDPKQYVTFANITYHLDWIQSVAAMESNNLFNLKDCGIDDHDASVPENDKPIFQQYPWITILEYDVTNSTKLRTMCGGVLIHPRFVITTGHCVCIACGNYKLKAVRLGDFDLSTNPDLDPDGEEIVAVSIPVTKVFHHPHFRLSGYGHNIAMIKLAEDAPTKMTNVKPICLPRARMFSENHFIVGWKREGISNVLKREMVQLQDVKQCVKVYKSIEVNLDPEESFLCATGSRRFENCFSFRSGSSMQYQTSLKGTNQYYLKGLYFFDLSICGPKSNSVFIDIGYYLKWIKRTVELEIS